MRKSLFAFVLAAELASMTPALAQQAGPNGGKIAGKDGHQTELIVSPTELTIYLIENAKVHPVKGASIRGVVQQGGKNETIAFKPADGNKLVAKLTAPLAKGAILVITGKDDHGHAISSRYVID